MTRLETEVVISNRVYFYKLSWNLEVKVYKYFG